MHAVVAANLPSVAPLLHFCQPWPATSALHRGAAAVAPSSPLIPPPHHPPPGPRGALRVHRRGEEPAERVPEGGAGVQPRRADVQLLRAGKDRTASWLCAGCGPAGKGHGTSCLTRACRQHVCRSCCAERKGARQVLEGAAAQRLGTAHQQGMLCRHLALQADALAIGKDSATLRADGVPEWLIPHKTFSGGCRAAQVTSSCAHALRGTTRGGWLQLFACPARQLCVQPR